MKHVLRTLGLALLVASTTGSFAQEEKKTNFVTQVTTRLVIPDGMNESEFWDTQRELFDKVFSKSKLVVHYSIYRHAWGSEGLTIVETMEFANWNDIDTFRTVERRALMEAAWPDEAARKAFVKKWSSFLVPHHKDEIYHISLYMRK